MRSIAIAATCAAVGLLAGCIPTAPTLAPESPTAAPSASPSPSPQVDGFVPNDVSDVLTSLTAPAGQEWSGGRATQIAGNTQSGFDWAFTDPEQCLIFLNAPTLTFSDDIDSGSQDRILTAQLLEPHDAGPEDDVYLATVVARVLEEPADAQAEVLGPVTDAAPGCGTYTGTITGLDWPVANVSALTVHPDTVVAGADQAVAVTYHEAEGGFGQQAVVFVQLDNVVLAVMASQNDTWDAEHDLLGEAVLVAQEVVAGLTGA